MTAAKPLRHQHFDRLTANFVPCVTKYALCLGVHHFHPAGQVDHHHRVWRGFHDLSEDTVEMNTIRHVAEFPSPNMLGANAS